MPYVPRILIMQWSSIAPPPLLRELANKINVNWCVSFENIGDEFEFVRHGAKWDSSTPSGTTEIPDGRASSQR